MKGIAHFAAGVALASCFPDAVDAAAAGQPLYFILGGLFGLLPDTLDFKVVRYFYRHDIEVTPDPLKPNPQDIAEGVAQAINRAHATGSRVRVKLNTIPVGLDRWQQYHMTIDVARRAVVARCGAVVDTGRNVVTETGVACRSEAVVPLDCEVCIDYLATTTVDIFDGPVFSMEPTGDQRIRACFIPWHRAWSHSLVVGGLLGLAAAAVGDTLAGIVVCGAWTLHALLDQLGYMGSALFYPFGVRRLRGIRLMASGDASANLVAVWCACLLIFWNLWRAAPGGVSPTESRALILYGMALPALVVALYRRMRSRVAASG